MFWQIKNTCKLWTLFEKKVWKFYSNTCCKKQTCIKMYSNGMHIFIHLHTWGICGKHMHDSNIVGTVADFVDQNSSSEKEITWCHADVIIYSSPSVSFFFHYFLLSHFMVTQHWKKQTRTPTPTFLSSKCAPKKLLCHDSFTTIHPSSPFCWKTMLYYLHVCCF